MILKYESSNGKTFDLKVSPLRARTADFHDYSWNPQVVNLQYGDKVTRFDRKAATYKMKLDVSGTLPERRQALNRLHEAFDHDIWNQTPGRIIHGDYYINGYVIVSKTGYNEPYTENEINIYCPDPFWIKESVYQFKKWQPVPSVYLEFPYGYAYDYRSIEASDTTLNVSGVLDADFKIKFYNFEHIFSIGVKIGGINRYVNIAPAVTDMLEFDTATKTIYHYEEHDGEYEKINAFDKRGKGSVSVFTPIKPGLVPVIWDRSFDFDLTIYERRSEPPWI